MKLKLSLLLLAMTVVLYGFSGAGGHKRKVLIIGIDGCRSDALQQAYTPNIDSIVAHGFYTYDSWHEDITWSGPSWSSILTGVYHEKHGITNNSYAGSNFNQYPYITTLAKQLDTTFKFIEYVTWSPLISDVYNDNWDVKILGTDGYTDGNGAGDCIQLQDPNVDLLFAYFDAVDITGHASGFSPANPAYMKAIDSVDVQVGNIMHTLRSRPSYASEDWLVLLVTDHGGIGNGHGGNSYQERHIWWIGYSDRGITRRVSGPQDTVLFNNPPDPGQWYNYPASQPDTAKQHLSPVQADIAVTALHHLIYNFGINPENQTAWNLDGKSWLCEMGLCSDKGASTGIVENKEFFFSVAPNPSEDGKFALFFDNADNTSDYYTVTDMQGAIVKKFALPATGIKHLIDLSSLPQGVYNLTVQTGSNTATKAIVIK